MWLPYLFPIWRQNDHNCAHVSCSIAPRTNIKVSIHVFSISRNIVAMSEFTSGDRHIGFQDGRHRFCIEGAVVQWLVRPPGTTPVGFPFPDQACFIIRYKNMALTIRDCLYLCILEETLKAVGPFYMASMPGEVKYPTQGVNRQIPCPGLHILPYREGHISQPLLC